MRGDCRPSARRRQRPAIRSALAGLLIAAMALGSSSAQGQPAVQSRAVPPPSYYLAMDVFESGDYATALRAFREAARDGVFSTEGRWIDSICYYAMTGECFYHGGKLSEAMAQYDAALKLSLAHRDWMLRVQFPATLDRAQTSARRRVTWGASRRGAVVARIPDKMLSFQGRLNNFGVLRQGGVLAGPELFSINVQEIVRCTALAMRRRREILGPLAPHDQLAADMTAAMSRRPAPANHWSQAWIDVQLGLALSMAGKPDQAASVLEKGLVAGGKFDHVLTAPALLELGQIALGQRKYEAAERLFLEATFAAAAMDQYDVMQEAFRDGALVHAVTNRRVIYPPLARAAAWADKHGSHPLQAWLLLLAAENYAELGQPAQAGRLLDQISRLLARHEMNTSPLAARFQYAKARVAYRTSGLTRGDQALSAALALQRNASPRLYQIARVDALTASTALTPREAESLMDWLLSGPTTDDWVIQPVETLAVATTPHLAPMERWFELVLARGKHDKALEIADRIRRHRFHVTLPFAGRLLALRWILEAPESALSAQAVLQRQDILAKFPAYSETAGRVAQLRRELRLLKLAPDEGEVAQRQIALLKQWAQLSSVQELMIRDIALHRQGAEMVFPPRRSVAQVQQSLPEGHRALIFFAIRSGLYGFALARDRTAAWRIDEPARVRQQLLDLLRQMGHFSKNQPLSAEQLADPAWRQPAAGLLRLLTDGADMAAFDEFDELVVVPDGILWYVPFGALQISQDDKQVSLMSKVRLRYAPTMSLAAPDLRPRRPSSTVAVVAGRMFPREDEAAAERTYQRLRKTLPQVERLPERLAGPSSHFSALCDTLVVLSDLDGSASGPYNWAPMRADRGRKGSRLADWMALPWESPQQVVLPGFHTPAEHGLRNGGDGSEMFLVVCGMMATGTRTLLLSRWRTGGPTAHALIQEFVSELPHTTAADAWQRSVLLATGSEIDADSEPRVKPAVLDEPMTAEHPFFWSGYLLVDDGNTPLPTP